MNRMDKSFNADKEAVLRYLDGEYTILVAGSFVTCAVTGQPIPLDDLRYWSVELQEPYATPEASLARHRARAG